MTLQEIVINIKRNKWIMECNRYKIDLWDLVTYTQEKIYQTECNTTSLQGVDISE
jgi:hypothetical protein